MTLLPVDYVLVLYNVLLIAVWTPLAATSDVARWMMGVHTVALSLPWLLVHAPAAPVRWLGALREIYPVVWLTTFWRELGIHCELVGSVPNDTLLAWLDRTVFRGNLNAAWPPAMPMGWFSELMQGVYFAYYVLFVGLVLYFLVRGDRSLLRDVILRLSAVYAAAYIVYAVAPTVGPMAMPEFPRFGGEGAHRLFRTLNDALQAAGDAAGTAFPSTHTAGAVTLAWLAWRYCRRWFAWLTVALAILVIPATVYTQNHFLLDAVGGAFLGLWLQALGIPGLDGIHRMPLWQAIRRPAVLPATELP